MSNTFSKSEHASKWIAVKNLSVVWRHAQRDLDDRWVKRIAGSFDPDLFNVITVTLANPDGIHHIIDGQHRVAAVREIFGDDETVPCNVFDVSDPVRAAQMFDRQNTDRRLPSAIAVFNVRVTGKNETETAVNKIITGCGYRVESSMGEGVIRAVGTCVSIYKRFGPEALRAALRSLSDTWGRDSDAVDSQLIKGYAVFFAEHGFEVDRGRLCERVSKTFTPGKLLNAGKVAREMFNNNIADGISMVLLKTYNHGLRTGVLGEKKRAA